MKRGATGVRLATWTAALALLACGAEPEEQLQTVAPTSRAALVLEPRTLQLGDVALAEIVVTTPPGQRVLPVSVPEIENIWLLDSETLRSESGDSRWIHRTRIRFRPRDIGRYEWPPVRVAVETADGERIWLETASRGFEVVSVLPEFPDRATPFGLRGMPSSPGGVGFGAGVAAGAGLALGLVALAMLARRRVRPSPVDKDALPGPHGDLWEWADAEFARALVDLDDDPRASANRGAGALRSFTTRRFGRDIEAATTQDLIAMRPPFAARSRWPELVRLLRNFDEVRFRPADDNTSDARRQQVAATLTDTRRFVEDSAPRGPSPA